MKIMKIMALAAGFISGAIGGVVIDVQVQDLTANNPPREQHLLVNPDCLRMSLENPNRENHYLIYRQDQNAVFVVSPDEKSYIEMTRDDVDKARERLKQITAQMEEAMKNMPPEQRAAMEKMMKGRLGGGDTAAQLEFKKIGPGQVGNWSATEYEVYRNGKKTSRAWVVPFSGFGLKREDFGVMKSLQQFYGAMQAGPAENYFRISQQLGGWPARSEILDDSGKTEMRVEVKDVKKQDIAADEFEIPTGFSKKEMRIPEGKTGQEP